MVLSITPNYQSIPDSVYMEIGRCIAEHHTGFQCVYALHKDTCFRHLHFLYNTVSYKDGKKFSQGPPDLNKTKMYCNHVLEKLNLKRFIGMSDEDILNDIPDCFSEEDKEKILWVIKNEILK